MSNILDVSKNFDEFISEGVVVIDFFATWCGPCKMLAPIIDKIADDMPQVKFGKVDVDQAMDLAKRFGIRSIPTVIIFKDGVQVELVRGLQDEEFLVETISSHI